MKILKPYIIELAETLAGHWYNVWKAKPDGSRGRFVGCFPSSTTILNAYPQSPQLTQWIAEQGWHESQRIKSEAGEKGTRVHAGCDLLEEGKTLTKDAYAIEEWHKLATFVKWHQEYKPELIVKEIAVFSPKYKFAGRTDRIYRINNEIYLVDFKTSKNLHEHFPLQLSSYAYPIEETTDLKIDNTALIQFGARNKNGYRFVIYPRQEWQEHFKVFRGVKKTWEYDNKIDEKESPVLELPKELKL